MQHTGLKSYNSIDSTLIGEAFLGAIRQAVREEVQALINLASLSHAYNQPRRVTKTHVSVKQAARMTSLAPSTIRLYIRQGKLKGHKAGRRMLIAKDDLEAFLSLHPTGVLPN